MARAGEEAHGGTARGYMKRRDFRFAGRGGSGGRRGGAPWWRERRKSRSRRCGAGGDGDGVARAGEEAHGGAAGGYEKRREFRSAGN